MRVFHVLLHPKGSSNFNKSINCALYNLSPSAGSTMSSAYFVLKIACPPTLKSPDPSRASLAKHSLYKSNKIDKKTSSLSNSSPSLHSSPPLGPVLLQHSHSVLINLLLRQSIPVTFRILINFTRTPCL